MKISQKFIFLLLVSLVASQPTFPSTPVSSSSSVVTVSTVGSGTLVAFSAAGWVSSSDYITNSATAGTVLTFVATPLLASASTSIGLIANSGTIVTGGATALGSATCAAPGTTYSGKTNLEGNGQSTTCPADFVSIYTAAPTTTSTTTSTNLVFSATGNARLIVGLPTTVAITVAAAGSCHAVTYSTYGLTAVSALASGTTCPTGTTTDNANALKTTATGTPAFGIYINAEGKAAVCLQSAANYLTSPGCGYLSNTYGKSSGSSILSVLAAPLIVMSAILLN